MKRLQLSRWVSDSAEVGCGSMQREVTAAVFSAGTVFPGLNSSGPGSQGETFPLKQEIFHYVKMGSFLALGGLKFLLCCCLGLRITLSL